MGRAGCSIWVPQWPVTWTLSPPSRPGCRLSICLQGAAGTPPHRSLFHIVLAWDVLAYLPSHRVDDLIGALAELCRPDARLHTIVPTTEMMPAVPNRYRIVDEENLVYEPVTTDLRGAPEIAIAIGIETSERKRRFR